MEQRPMIDQLQLRFSARYRACLRGQDDRLPYHRFAGTASIALLLFGLCSLGCGARTGLEVPEPVEVPEEDNAHTCTCECFDVSRPGGTPRFPRQMEEFQVCLPPELNQNNEGALSLTAERLEADCAERLPKIARGAAAMFAGTTCDWSCECTSQQDPHFGSDECNNLCEPVPLIPDGRNLKEATVGPEIDPCPPLNNEPVCRVPGSDPPEQPEGAFATALTAESTGIVTEGRAHIELGGRERDTAVTGQVVFPGAPCPDASCEVGMAFRLQGDSIGFSKFLGLGKVRLRNLTAGGAGTPGALVIGPDGRGSYPVGTVEAWGRGTKVKKVAGVETDKDTRAFVLSNTSPIDVELDWEGRTFAVDDEFSLPPGDDPEAEPALSVQVNVEGVLVNQPPTARIATEPVVECTSSEGAEVTLDATPSSDPDDNIGLHSWRRGVGFDAPELAFTPVVTLLQAPRTTETYSVLIADTGFEPSTSEATVSVVDTTPPSVGPIELDRDCLWPPNHKWVRLELGTDLRAEVEDVCDPSPLLRIDDVRSSEPEDGLGDGSTQPDVLFGETGVCLRAERSGRSPDGRTYTIVLAAEDLDGNTTRVEGTVRVPHDDECDPLPPEDLVARSEVEARCNFPPAVREEPPPPAPPRVVSSSAPPPPPAAAEPPPPAGERGSCRAASGGATGSGSLLFVFLAAWMYRRRHG